jgi:acetyltransferase
MCGGEIASVLGVKHDQVFGLIVMTGLGGIVVQVTWDVEFRRAPVTSVKAARMLEKLRERAVLAGACGSPPVDRARLVELICGVVRLAAVAHPRFAEQDLNPVLVPTDLAVAVAWLFVLD